MLVTGTRWVLDRGICYQQIRCFESHRAKAVNLFGPEVLPIITTIRRILFTDLISLSKPQIAETKQPQDPFHSQ